jgi:hypothetical protein
MRRGICYAFHSQMHKVMIPKLLVGTKIIKFRKFLPVLRYREFTCVLCCSRFRTSPELGTRVLKILTVLSTLARVVTTINKPECGEAVFLNFTCWCFYYVPVTDCSELKLLYCNGGLHTKCHQNTADFESHVEREILLFSFKVPNKCTYNTRHHSQFTPTCFGIKIPSSGSTYHA